MNKTLRNVLIALTAVVLAVAIFFAGNWMGRANSFSFFNMMRGRNGMMNNNNRGLGMMNGNRGMMNRYGYNNTNLTPLSIDQAKTAAESYLANLNNPDLKVSEIMVFDNNAYILVREISTGKGAFELLADSTSQIAYPEHGPNMMWNLKYSNENHQNMMGGNGGMMNGYGVSNTSPSAEMTVTPEQAVETAQKYLDANIAGAKAATDPITFYGYYTLDYEVNGNVDGMLSVNGYTGQVFLHTWHGKFIEEAMMDS